MGSSSGLSWEALVCPPMPYHLFKGPFTPERIVLGYPSLPYHQFLYARGPFSLRITGTVLECPMAPYYQVLCPRGPFSPRITVFGCPEISCDQVVPIIPMSKGPRITGTVLGCLVTKSYHKVLRPRGPFSLGITVTALGCPLTKLYLTPNSTSMSK